MPTETPLATIKRPAANFQSVAYGPNSTAGTLMLTSQARSTPAASSDIVRMDAEIIFIKMRQALDDMLRELLVQVQQGKARTMEQQKKRLLFDLDSAFDDIPLESCVAHPADEILARALQKAASNPAIFQFIREFCLDFSRPDLAASVLRCLSRQPAPQNPAWRMGLVRDSLASKSLDVRDAAVQAADSWQDDGMVSILQSHQEPEPWLQEYIDEIVADLKQ